MSDLGKKQWVPLSDGEHKALGDIAVERGLGRGLLARVLLVHGLDHVDEPEIAELIEEEKTATKKRVSDGARVAIAARWGNTKKETP
ncbi:hypothetical protein [Rothia halotolerans]|uniref:hypothetical protein n=1 Tax=Rothia halotolerans TaxID=405770 RepID=UPI00101C043B|nr:hypothetical protein [Rothia halotolerans]